MDEVNETNISSTSTTATPHLNADQSSVLSESYVQMEFNGNYRGGQTGLTSFSLLHSFPRLFGEVGEG